MDVVVVRGGCVVVSVVAANNTLKESGYWPINNALIVNRLGCQF
jgi:hypothetical protein